jgi:hypothetical protein
MNLKVVKVEVPEKVKTKAPVPKKAVRKVSPRKITEVEAALLKKWCDVLEEGNIHSYLEYLTEGDRSGTGFVGDEEDVEEMWSILDGEIEDMPTLQDYKDSIDWKHLEQVVKETQWKYT